MAAVPSRQQALLVGGIDPGPGHDARAVARAHLVLVRVDQRVERGTIDQALFDQKRFQRLDPQGRIGRNDLMVVAVFVAFVLRVQITLRGCRSRGSQKTPSSGLHRFPV